MRNYYRLAGGLHKSLTICCDHLTYCSHVIPLYRMAVPVDVRVSLEVARYVPSLCQGLHDKSRKKDTYKSSQLGIYQLK